MSQITPAKPTNGDPGQNTITRTSPPIKIMSYDKARAPSPFRAVPIPDIFCPWIGKIAVTWSFFENAFDYFLVALTKANGGPPENEWARQNFKKRKKLFHALCRATFAANPSLESALISLGVDAAELQWQRNFLLHGKLHSVLEARHNSDLSELHIHADLYAKSRRNGEELTIKFDELGLEDLFYRIAHVSGRLEELSSPDANPQGLTSDDKSRLRDFLIANHPFPATPSKRPSSPQSFGA